MSEIPYCERVLEVTGGCTKCSPGCRICWALDAVWRLVHNPNPKLANKWKGLVEKKEGVLNWTGTIKCFADALNIPLHRKKPTIYFVDSKADLFHEKVPFSFTDRFFDTMFRCPQHTFLIFTKRIEQAFFFVGAKGVYWHTLPNVQFILSISTQLEADEKIPILLQIPAAVRGISAEPLLESIDFQLYCGDIDWFILGCESGSKRNRRSISLDNFQMTLNSIDSQSAIYVKQVEINGKVSRDINQFPEDLRIQELPERK